MVYYLIKEHTLEGFEKSNTKNKMYDAILRNSNGRKFRVPFGDSTMENFQDKTRLNLYPQLIHGDEKRRKSFRARASGFVKNGYYSPGYFSLNYLW
jgi:hypothetical protein